MSTTQGDDAGLEQFHEVFFEEAAERLAEMEGLLVGIDLVAPDTEHVNAIFRAAHSIKGGAATFGFADITEVTHEMETVFDLVRRGELSLSREMVDAFLAASDMLSAMLAVRRGTGEAVDEQARMAMCERLSALPSGALAATPAAPAAVSPPPVVEVAAVPAPAAAPSPSATGPLLVHVGPLGEDFNAAAVEAVLAELRIFGPVEELPTDAADPLHKRFRMTSSLPVAELKDILVFCGVADRVRLEPESPAPAAAAPSGEGEAYGLFAPEPAPAPKHEHHEHKHPHKAAEKHKHPAPAQGNGEAASIRVATEKVDQLINLVGELVITQAMLAQTATQEGGALSEALANSLAQLERNTRQIQEASMAIRMVPMSFVFSRFPRVVRDVAGKLGKEVTLVTEGENTELDKSLIEGIVDPLTHLVRNSLDHGLEKPEDREAAGKPRKGTIRLAAFHQSGNIVIAVTDDGRGLDREKILSKARERGMHAPDSMTDAEVWNLIFEPGFSTAAVVTDVSGRGVGMDVVRRNIKSLGGRVDIESVKGEGSTMTIRLPLTLAILDGMSVRVGQETYILPITAIAEALQVSEGAVKSVAGQGNVISVRGEYLPVVSLAESLGLQGDAQRFEDGILVILDAEGARTALFVDDLVAQHQVVIKNLEANYRKVPGVAGATIMGDGRVAFILDVAHFVIKGRAPLALAA